MKTFEDFNRKPKIGDWIINEDDIGKINNITNNNLCYVNFPDISTPTKNFNIPISDITHFGTQEEMQIQLQANKYNI